MSSGKVSRRRFMSGLTAAAATSLSLPFASARGAIGRPLRIVGCTVIDGNGGTPSHDMSIQVADGRICSIGRFTAREASPDDLIIDGRGKFLLPGFIDTNVHLTFLGELERARSTQPVETIQQYVDRQSQVARQVALRFLQCGVTTIRDSYGLLPALLRVRDAFASGASVGPRVRVAGNIVGWGGPYSHTFRFNPPSGDFAGMVERAYRHGVGEELIDWSPSQVRDAISAYLDRGPDFIKYGATPHFNTNYLIFSPDVQRAIVDEVHRHGKLVDTHASGLEPLRMALNAGVDLVQHPEVRWCPFPITDELIAALCNRNVGCSMNVSSITGSDWEWFMRPEGEQDRTRLLNALNRYDRPSRVRVLQSSIELSRSNAIQIIRSGCRVTVASDHDANSMGKSQTNPRLADREPGRATLAGIEGLVELGMTPLQAITAATRNGAMADRSLSDYGTIEVGKCADLVLLHADPLEDIANVRRIAHVIRAGQVVER